MNFNTLIKQLKKINSLVVIEFTLYAIIIIVIYTLFLFLI